MFLGCLKIDGVQPWTCTYTLILFCHLNCRFYIVVPVLVFQQKCFALLETIMRAKYPPYHNLPYVLRNSKFFSVVRRSKKRELFEWTTLFRIHYFIKYLAHCRRRNLPYALFQANCVRHFASSKHVVYSYSLLCWNLMATVPT